MRCEICGDETDSLKICRLCGRAVCIADYDSERDMCRACSMTICEICRKFHSIGYCKICERLICEDCSVKDGAGYLCKECLGLLNEKNR